jgi:hypothetical protein
VRLLFAVGIVCVVVGTMLIAPGVKQQAGRPRRPGVGQAARDRWGTTVDRVGQRIGLVGVVLVAVSAVLWIFGH